MQGSITQNSVTPASDGRPSRRAVSRMACITACAVGSPVERMPGRPWATIASSTTATEPSGCSPAAAAAAASASAALMYSS